MTLRAPIRTLAGSPEPRTDLHHRFGDVANYVEPSGVAGGSTLPVRLSPESRR